MVGGAHTTELPAERRHLKRVYVSVATRAIRPGESFRQTGDLPALAGLPDLLRKGDTMVRQLAVLATDGT